MPIYPYTCNECGHEFEVIEKFSDPPQKECPKCHKKTLKRQIGLSNVIFKGTGWTPKGNE